jgi:hypothetical protein
MVPLTITEELTQEVKSYVRSLIPESTAFDEYYPEVVLSYATGRREQDCPGAGPGMYYAAGVVRILHECGLQCFSGLHVPVGRDWKVFMLRLANAKVLIIIKTAALYESKPCLEEINSAIELGIPLIPICFQEKNLPGRREQWAKFTDERSELIIANVQEHLGKINDIPNPGTLLNVPSTLDETIAEINKHVTIKAHVHKPKPAIQTAAMVTVTADPEPEPAFATTAPEAQLWVRARAHDLQLWREGPGVLEARAGTAGAGCESGETEQLCAPSRPLLVTCRSGRRGILGWVRCVL